MMLKYYDSVVNLSGALVATLIFLSGIGRYRVVLIYALYYLLNAVLSVIRPKQKVPYVLLPATIVAFYLDVKAGPLLPIFEWNSLLLAAIILMVVDTVVKSYLEKLIATSADNKFFVICPSCGKDHMDLVERCTACSYEQGTALKAPTANISPSFVGDKLPPKVLRMLRLETNEDILFHTKIAGHAVFINDVKNVRLHFLLTTKNVILLDYYRLNLRFSNTWREMDVIPLSMITAIEAKMEKFTLSPQPLISIRTSLNDGYKIVFYSKNKCKANFDKFIQSVKQINPEIENSIDIPEDDIRWNRNLEI